MLVGGVGVSEADVHVAGAGGSAKNLAGCSPSATSGAARFWASGSMVISRPGIDIVSPSMRTLGADLVRTEPGRFAMMGNGKEQCRGQTQWFLNQLRYHAKLVVTVGCFAFQQLENT